MNHMIDVFSNWCASQSQAKIDDWTSDYFREGLVIFENFGSKEFFNHIYLEASFLLDSKGERKNLAMEPTGNTPRKYLSVGRDAILINNGTIPKLFECRALINLFSAITKSKVHPVDYTPEQYIINRQECSGDTHGWHCDDYTWAFIWIMDASKPGCGGSVEYIPDVDFDYSSPKESLGFILGSRETRSIWLPSGTAYLMHASKTLHRVTPITEQQKRSVVVMTFASDFDLSNTISHSTMDIIYPKDTATTKTQVLPTKFIKQKRVAL